VATYRRHYLEAAATQRAWAAELASWLSRLDPGAEDRTRATAALVWQIAHESDHDGWATSLPAAIARLAVTSEEERTRAKEALLALHARKTNLYRV
jgi:hypothetical protein